MKFMKYLLAIALAMILVACGGGGGSSGSTPGGSTTGGSTTGGSTSTPLAETPNSVEVLTSSNTLFSAGSEVTLTAFVKSAANVALAGKSVSFSASSGTLQIPPTLVTDANGVVTAKLSAGSDKSMRDITVTVTVGAVSGKIVVPVTGTRISIAGAGSMQSGATPSKYIIRVLDSSDNPITGSVVAIKSAVGNPLSSASVTTDATGSASFFYTPNSSGRDTLSVSGLGASATTDIVVNAIDFAVLSPASNTTIEVGASQLVTVRYRLSGAGVSGKTVSFSTTRGSFVSAGASSTTNTSGIASATLKSTTAGPATVVAQIDGVGQVNLPVQFVASNAASILVQANPGAVLPNPSGTTVNQSTIEAVVHDSAGNAVANKTINFSILQDVSNGTLSTGVATTDANGRAQVQFIPGATSTPANGVVIQAEVATTGIRSTTSLTVNGQALFISLGFGNTISNLDVTTYSKPFSVYVTDANGVAVGNQIVTLSVIPEVYHKGRLVAKFGILENGWFFPDFFQTCPNEDIDGNGVLAPAEDINNDGQLTPGNVVVASPGTVRTDASGRAVFDLQYGEQYAWWAKVRITARASVGGTESRESILFELAVSPDDVADPKIAPANAVSPFGTVLACDNPN